MLMDAAAMSYVIDAMPPLADVATPDTCFIDAIIAIDIIEQLLLIYTIDATLATQRAHVEQRRLRREKSTIGFARVPPRKDVDGDAAARCFCRARTRGSVRLKTRAAVRGVMPERILSYAVATSRFSKMRHAARADAIAMRAVLVSVIFFCCRHAACACYHDATRLPF